MKNLCAFVIMVFLLLPAATVSANVNAGKPFAGPGEITAISLSDPYPTLGEPVNLILTVAGDPLSKFNETILVTDEFQGMVMVNGLMTWESGTVPISNESIAIGRMPVYTKKIAWYPSLVGNHTFHISAGSSPEQTYNVSVCFDVQGIIEPSFGCPSIIRKDSSPGLSVAVAENRDITDEPAQLLQGRLQEVNSGAVYELTTLTAAWSAWVAQGNSTLQDELITMYDVSSVPCGFYNISVTTEKGAYEWPHAVEIMDGDPVGFTVLHLTDIHIGKYYYPVDKVAELTRLITYANEQIHPDFIIVSGDSVDWYNPRCHRNVFLDLREALLTSTVPIFMTPGNHERYRTPLLFLYYPFTNLTPYHEFLNPLDDYSVQYGGVNFVFLDSGHDYSRWEIDHPLSTTPESSGLTNTQMYLLLNTWGDPVMNQIITMHHPAVNDKNDSGLGAVPNNLPSGNDECIAFNRGAFISYCLTGNVSLALAGHTHENIILDANGRQTDENSSAWPLFVQTRSSTLSGQQDGGRIIHIENGMVEDYDYMAFP